MALAQASSASSAEHASPHATSASRFRRIAACGLLHRQEEALVNFNDASRRQKVAFPKRANIWQPASVIFQAPETARDSIHTDEFKIEPIVLGRGAER